MSLLLVTAVVVGGAALATAVTAVALLGRDGLAGVVDNLRSRPREVLQWIGLLFAVLGVNKALRTVSPEVSEVIGWNITGAIHGIEGSFVADLQSLATPWLTAYLATVYLCGYVFLLSFPFVAYASIEDLRPLKRASIGVALNYVIGLLLYTLFVSYGPRNMLPTEVEPLLYATYPQTQILTSQVNTNTNVFPSLHTSLSVTIALFAWETRERFPRWPLVAIPIAASVVFSTMYLGIHWATDVVAGCLLGAFCVWFATRLR
ncbi:inositol phosphorylceramide synthase (plasmid) [Halorarum halophilum]|uniref:Inositol phosphorylceramide synthase n=1 Tax=Halorarum halophilum TaxID=2743090 RepID=A0A7D5KYB5_9EURY|nr:phosphatase PAP2 family protein [Halobaculum halophilum]QLG29718.1 inositol phosphorylceramide synthase [Halobaculum halophilum]